MQIRQGDIFFETIVGLDKSKLKVRDNHIIAYGEVTGHCHQVTTPMSECESYVDEDGDIFIRSQNEIKVGHDEHDTITLPSNKWVRISRQREYDPLSVMRERKVAD